MLTYLVACTCFCIVITVDYEKSVVPVSFPGTIGPIPDPTGEEDAIINPGYRQYDNATNEEFYYFITRILPAINPGKSNFRQRKEKDLISDIFTVADEAFGMILLHNEYHVWEDQQERKGQDNINTNAEKKRKRYCDAKSGSRDGWMKEGQELFHDLCKSIDELRKQPETGVQLEEMIRKRFMEESGTYIESESNSTPKQTKKVKEPYADDVVMALYNDAEIQSI